MVTIIVSTFRSDIQVIANLIYLSSFANNEIAMIISDCSGSIEKINKLKEISSINSNIKLLVHGQKTPLYPDLSDILLNESVNTDYVVFCADDDYMSYEYIINSIKTLNENIDAVSSYGNYLICNTNGNVFIDSRSSKDPLAIDRIANGFSPNYFNSMIYSVFRYKALLPWASFCKNHPLIAVFFDFILCLSIMAQGKIITHDKGYYLWTGENWDTPEKNQQSRIRHYQTIGISDHFHIFHDLHFAVECANFLLGKNSPLARGEERESCAQITWERCMERFRASVQQNEGVYINALSSSPIAIESLKQLYHLPYCHHPQRIEWFANIIEVYSLEIADCYRQHFTTG